MVTTSSGATSAPSRIMIVDDSRAVLEGIRLILSNAQHQVFCTTLPKEALTQLETFNPDLIICDLDMPEMNGYEFIKAVRADVARKSTPILVLTGVNDSRAMAQSILCGADAFTPKETIRYAIEPQILALLRIKCIREEALRGKQLSAVQTLIGTYKHDFGNLLAIIEGKTRILIKNHPELEKDPSLQSIQNSAARLLETLKKLDELRTYEEIDYSKGSKTLKI